MTGTTEATLQLDRLDGVLAEMFARRLALHEQAGRDAGRTWARLARHVDVPDLVRQYRASLGLVETRSEEDDEHEAIAIAAARSALHRLADLVFDEDEADDFDRLRRTFETVLRSGRAEGVADAVVMAAERLDKLGQHTLALDFKIAFEHAYAALERKAEQLAGESGKWLSDILGGQARDVGALLARLTREGASYADMVRGVSDLLTDADARAVQTVIDLMTSRSMSQGALDLYASEGIGQVDFVTAGDDRVCPICTDCEIKGPYGVGESPTPGIHPHCRCVLMPTSVLSATTVGAYLEGGP
ncbi:hypothetical protein [Embleya sp. NPDC005971]|uniref:hypothetical protein n=1 Tax=Embleya sp. NPDC005971 TaxID=3156724 RepID=UPI0033F9CB7F